MDQPSDLPTPPLTDVLVPPPNAPREVPKRSRSKLYAFLGIIFFCVIGIGGVFLGKFLYIPKIVPTPQVAVTPTPAPSATPTSDPTAGWNEYRNDRYGFELWYPEDWKVLETPTQVYQTDNHQVWLSSAMNGWPPPHTDARAAIVFSFSDKDPEANWQPQYFNNYQKLVYQLGNISAYKISGMNKEGLFNETVVLAKIGSSFLSVLSNDGPEAQQYFDRILSTFKFLDQKVNNISSWKTYTAPDSSFSFQYPSNWYYENSPGFPTEETPIDISFFEQGTRADHSYGDHKGSETFTITLQNDQRTLDNLIKDYYKDGTIGNFGNKQAIKTPYGLYIVKLSASQMLIVTGFSRAQPYVDQILSTFKFTN